LIGEIEAGAVPTQTVGVLGGMGPAATVDFLAKIVAATPAERDQDHLHVLVDCNPQVPDRTAFLRSQGEDPRPSLIVMATGLERLGASFLVMPCNTAHAFAEDIRAAIAIPLVDWPGVVADAVLAAGVKRVGILATSGTIFADIYRIPLEERGLESVVPTASGQAELMRAIYGVEGIKHVGPDSRVARHALMAGAADVVRQGAAAVVLACTEFSLVRALGELEVGVPVFDASDIVARHVVGRALGRSIDAEGAG
jgi:aspartate racemase